MITKSVYQFKMYDIQKGENVTSEEFATEEAIARLGTKKSPIQPIRETELEIDEALIDGNGFYKPK